MLFRSYRDQANDSATVRHFRKTSGMPDWYKKKYGHVDEEVQQEGAVPSTEKVITLKHKTSGKTLKVVSSAAERYKKIGYHVVKEEVVMEREDDEYHTPTKHYVKVQVSKGDGPKTHFKATVKAKEPQHAVNTAIAHYKKQGYTVHKHEYLGDRKSTRLNSSHVSESRMPSSA